MNKTNQFICDFFEFKICKAEHGIGSFVDLYFSKSNKTQDTKPIHVWIYLCDWWIEISNTKVLDFDSIGNENTKNVLDEFIGCSLIDFLIDEDGLGATFLLTKGIKIIIKADVDNYELDDLFLVFSGEEPLWGFVPEKGLHRIEESTPPSDTTARQSSAATRRQH